MFNENMKRDKVFPKYIEGYGEVTPYQGPFASTVDGLRKSTRLTSSLPGEKKTVGSLREAIQKVNLRDGMVISFHHHLRNGDDVVNSVVKEIAGLGIKDITICASSLTSAHDDLFDYIIDGTITGIHTSGLRGKIAQMQSKHGILKKPVVFRTHGGRARAIEAGDVSIDVAFVAASACDEFGNMNGKSGKSAFGAMGYPMVDVQFADKVIAVTDNLQPFPLPDISIPMTYVDYVVPVDSLGDISKIASGATRITDNPTDLLIAKRAAEVLIAAGAVKEGFSFQAGSGGPSLAVCKFLRDYMINNSITGSFAAGGVTSYLVSLLEEGLFMALLDTQTFDSRAAESLRKNPNHIEMSASMYANPNTKSCSAHQLDIMILSATEIDEDFNLNSLTGSTGVLMGALGGAPDTAAGAKLTVVVAPTMRKRIPIVVERVTNIVTPGETVDVLVTERGICVHPNRKDIKEALVSAGIDVIDISELRKNIENLTGAPEKPEYMDEIIGVVEYRDGTVIDLVYKVV